MDSAPPDQETELDPTFVMLDESDDEETIAQEELMEPEIDPEEELKVLAEDLNVTLEELTAQSGSDRSKRKRKRVDYQAMLLEEHKKKNNQWWNPVIRQPKSLAEMCSKALQDIKVDQAGPSNDLSRPSTSFSELTELYMTNTASYEDEDEDVDYKPMLKPKYNREIRTGPLYQAVVPDESAANDNVDEDAHPIDRLMWKPPLSLGDADIESYLCRVNGFAQELTSAPAVICNRLHHRDNEQALQVLLQCNFDQELALNTFRELVKRLMIQRNIPIRTNNGRVNNENRANNSNNARNGTNNGRASTENGKMPKK